MFFESLLFDLPQLTIFSIGRLSFNKTSSFIFESECFPFTQIGFPLLSLIVIGDHSFRQVKNVVIKSNYEWFVWCDLPQLEIIKSGDNVFETAVTLHLSDLPKLSVFNTHSSSFSDVQSITINSSIYFYLHTWSSSIEGL